MTRSERTKVVVFSPHPDDDVIGCGGRLLRHVKEGHDVEIVYLTSGEAGSLDIPKKQLRRTREKEAKEALRSMGISRFNFLKMPDGALEVNGLNLERITRLVRSRKPRIVYMPHVHDAHRDHRITYELVKEALWRAGGPWFQKAGKDPWKVGLVLCYEVWSPLQEFAYVEDISNHLDRKLRALRYHESQMRSFDYMEGVKALNRFRGAMTGRGEYCECYQVMGMGGGLLS